MAMSLGNSEDMIAFELFSALLYTEPDVFDASCGLYCIKILISFVNSRKVGNFAADWHAL